ncbi:MAG: hypothetical protein AAF622_10665, partial [Cyanobacteria bacterium P01_C01_bin.147]
QSCPGTLFSSRSLSCWLLNLLQPTATEESCISKPAMLALPAKNIESPLSRFVTGATGQGLKKLSCIGNICINLQLL